MASNASHSFSKQLSRVFTEKVNQDSIAKMKSMNLAIYEDELRELRSKGLVAMFFVLLSIFSGAVIMMFIEGWFFLDSLYWACVTVIAVLCMYVCMYVWNIISRFLLAYIVHCSANESSQIVKYAKPHESS